MDSLNYTALFNKDNYLDLQNFSITKSRKTIIPFLLSSKLKVVTENEVFLFSKSVPVN